MTTAPADTAKGGVMPGFVTNHGKLTAERNYLQAEVERLREAVRDLLDELADEGVDTVNHPARQLVEADRA